MNCTIYQEKMTDWVGEDPQKLPGDISLHLRQCESCSREWAELQSLAGEIKSADFVSDPGELFWQRQRTSILEQVKKPSSFSWFPRWAMVFSVGFILLFLGYQLQWKPKHFQSADSMDWLLEEGAEDEEDTQEMIEQLSPDQIETAIQTMEKKIHQEVL